MKKLIKHDATFYRNLLDSGLSVIPIFEVEGVHKPAPWVKYQTELATKQDVTEWHKSAVGFGLVCGYGDVEAIDLDTKILPTKKDKDIFTDEYFGLLENHIHDFWNKVALVETQSAGYHIIYRCKKIDGNSKIAKIKGSREALIETRGVGGFVHIYKVVKGLQYHEIDYITQVERKLIWDISKMYDHVDEEPISPKIKSDVKYKKEGITPWVDYANKNTVWDVCSDDFEIVKRLSNSVMIKRIGAESFYSGHIYNDTGKMF